MNHTPGPFQSCLQSLIVQSAVAYRRRLVPAALTERTRPKVIREPRSPGAALCPDAHGIGAGWVRIPMRSKTTLSDLGGFLAPI